MENDNEKFEEYLNEFELKRPRALPEVNVHREIWARRLAAAAAIAIVLGASLWLLQEKKDTDGKGRVAQEATFAPLAKSEPQSLSLLPFTRMALKDPLRFEAELTVESRRVLPDFRGKDSTLRVLAKE